MSYVSIAIEIMDKNEFTADELKVVDYFNKQVRSDNVPSYQDLEKYIKRRQINFGSKTDTQKTLRKIKNNILEPAAFSNRKRVKHHQSVTPFNLGLLSADFGYYKPRLKSYNNRNIGFLMVVSVNAHKRWAVPMKSRKMEAFEDALEEVCLGDVFPAVNTVISDRETAVFSEKFQKKMKKKHNINFEFMYRHNKSWEAENALRYVKEDLTIILNSKNNAKRWVDILPSVIATHNRMKLGDTNYTPNDINDKNFQKFLSDYYGVKDITTLFNSSSISMKRKTIPEKWRKKTLKIDVGDKVLVSFRALEGTKIMEKSSVEGTFSRNAYYVSNVFLRNTKNKKDLVPGIYFIFAITLTFYIVYIILFFFSVYALTDDKNKKIPGLFYKEQIKPYPKYGSSSRIR